MRLEHLELKPISSKNVQIIPFCFNSATLAAVNDFLTVRSAFHTLYGFLPHAVSISDQHGTQLSVETKHESKNVYNESH